MSTANGDIIKTVMEVSLEDGTIAQNVYYHEAEIVGSPVSDATVLTALELCMEAAYSELSAYLPSTITQRVCTVQEVEWDSGEGQWEVSRLVGYFTPTIGFNDANEPLPNQSAAYASFMTNRPKSFGRKAIFPFAEDAQDGTFLVAGALTAMSDYADEILDDLLIGGLDYLVPGVPREALELFLQFTGAVVTNVLGTQRRRKPGVGA